MAGPVSVLLVQARSGPGQAAVHLREALTIYQRIGGPGVQRVQETLSYLTKYQSSG
jgi:hypothetical protein